MPGTQDAQNCKGYSWERCKDAPKAFLDETNFANTWRGFPEDFGDDTEVEKDDDVEEDAEYEDGPKAKRTKRGKTSNKR